MVDRRPVDDLSIEELEQVLRVRRRELRHGRLRRLAEVGRIAEDPPVSGSNGGNAPEQDLHAVADTDDQGAFSGAGRFAAVEYESGLAAEKRVSSETAGGKSRISVIRDRALLGLEMLALIGLVAILIGSLSNLRTLNEEVAQARELITPTAPPLIQVAVLPGGSAPPTSANDIPVAYRNLVKPMPPMQVPTPAPQRPTRIVIPAIDVDATVVHGDDWEDLKKGAGHHIGTANPGERGNMVISAHNDVFGEIFRYLENVELEDRITVYSGAQAFDYVVKAKRVVDPGDVSVMSATSQPVLTLITCYPYLIDTHRLVVIAQLDR